MKLSVEKQLLKYLQKNRTIFASATLQRMEWRNRNGTLATPRSIVRRLEELTEQGVLEVSYDRHGNAHYNAKEDKIEMPPVFFVKHPITGERITTEEYSRL